jgi:hypothetical protein
MGGLLLRFRFDWLNPHRQVNPMFSCQRLRAPGQLDQQHSGREAWLRLASCDAANSGLIHASFIGEVALTEPLAL